MPKFSEFVVDGHVNTGYNLGQLIYVLALNGFDVRGGHFIEYGYSLCAFVQKRYEIPRIETMYPIQELKDKKILPDKIIRNLKYPNKMEVMYGYKKNIAIGYPGNFKYLNFPSGAKLLHDYQKSQNEMMPKFLSTIWERICNH